MIPLFLSALLTFNEPVTLDEPIRSVGKVPQSREEILVDIHNSPTLDEHFDQFIDRHGHLEEKELIEALTLYIKNEILDSKNTNMLAVAKAIEAWGGSREVPLDFFAEQKTAVCRHTALFAVYFLQKLKNAEYLKGTIIPIRDTLTRGPHAWCLFAGKDEIWHIDPLWGIALPAKSPQLDPLYGEKRMIPQRKKVLFFDLGGVIVNFNHEKMCTCFSEALNIPLPEVKELLGLAGTRFDRGEEDPYTPLIKHRFPELFSIKTEMVELLKALKKEGAILWTLSNTVNPHIQYLRKTYDFLDLFDGYILSYEIGLAKPDEEIYEYALKAAGVSPEDAGYIDDIPHFAETASKKGIDSHAFEGIETLTPVLKKWGFGV